MDFGIQVFQSNGERLVRLTVADTGVGVALVLADTDALKLAQGLSEAAVAPLQSDPAPNTAVPA